MENAFLAAVPFLHTSWQVVEVIAAIAISFVLLTFVVEPCFSRVVGKALKTLLQSIDKRVLGVNLTFGHLRVNLCCLKATIEGLTVENPEGYSSPFLLRLDEVHLNFGLRRLLCSLGRRLAVQQLELDGVEVNVERKLTSSNVAEVLANLARRQAATSGQLGPQDREQGMARGDDVEAGGASPCCSCCGGCCCGWCAGSAEESKGATKRKVEVHTVVVRGVAVNLQAWMFKMKLRAADMDFQDLTEEVKGHEIQVLAQLLLESLLASVLANLPAGDYVQQAWDRRKDRAEAEDAGSDSDASTTSLFSGSSNDSDVADKKTPCTCCG